jgi:putative nucleotidyltransferase with HDIG domain
MPFPATREFTAPGTTNLNSRNRKSDLRRIEARRQRSEYRDSFWRTALARTNPFVLLIWVGFFAATVAVLLTGGDSLPYYLNQKVNQDIYARVPFQVENLARTRQERQIAVAQAPSVFLANPAPLEAIRGELTELLNIAKSAEEPDKIRAAAAARGWQLGEPAVSSLKTYANTEQSTAYAALVAKLIDKLSHEYIVEPYKNALREQPPRTSILQRGSDRVEITTTTLQFCTNRDYVQQRTQELAAEVFPEPLRPAVAAMLVRRLTPRAGSTDTAECALWRYDQTATLKEIDEAKNKVPTFTTPYKTRDLLVEAGTVLSSNELDLLDKENTEFLKAQKTDPDLRRSKLLQNLGLAGLVLIVTFGLAAYTLSYQGRIFQNPGRALALAGLCLFMILVSRLNESLQLSWDSPVEFSVACVVMSAILLTIAYNQRFAFGVCGTLSILVTLASRANFWLFLTLLAGCGVLVFSLKEVRTRGKIIAVAALAAAVAALTCAFGYLYTGQDWKYVVTHAAAAAMAALAGGFIVQGILHYFERIFGIATSLTLLEWCDAGQPLLRKLAQEAPGTYSHALILSQMADEAASAIGANGLLARVGALYHDIGKTQKSHYFVENQEARMNRHDRLSPTMSLLIILGHVKDGIEMARAYGLPRVLHQFIAEHHGTTIVKYFHHAASEKAARDSRIKGRHDQVSESEFRYPGPKPRSKESAILMICDSCEGAVRALPEPTPGRIETLIHQIIMERLNDGQFDDCDITLRELNIVERSLVKSLCAIHHGRIKYPGKATAADKPKPEARPEESAEEGRAAGAPATAAEVVRQS